MVSKNIDLMLCFVFCSAALAHAASPCDGISFASMFRSQAVLQREPATPNVYGNAPPNTVLQITLSSHTQQVTADSNGKWMIALPAQPAQWNVPLQVRPANSQACSVAVTVSFGETILCSGQSNMGMPVIATSPCCQLPPAQQKGCHCFQADNGTAEVAAADRYAGKIVLAGVTGFQKDHNGTYCPYPWTNRSCLSGPEWNAVMPGREGTIAKFSAICWYTGTALFDSLGGKVPVGLIAGAVGGSPIEFWLPRGHVNNTEHCGIDSPPCDNGGAHAYRDSDFYDQLISPFAPYSIGTVVWDQGERDTHCLPQAGGGPGPENHTARYGCMLHQLVTSWRAAFQSKFGFVNIQLPGYLGDCGTYDQCMAEVFPMRLQQQKGLVGLDSDAAMATVTPTYDLGCDFSAGKTDLCPFGTVHNVFKRPIGTRVAQQILVGIKRRQLEASEPAERSQWPGPVLESVRAASTSPGSVTVNVTFKVQVSQAPTLNCAACCTKGNVGDFDVSFDSGTTWINGTRPSLTADHKTLQFRALAKAGSSIDMMQIRYTANQAFPQCAVYAAGAGEPTNAGIPAMPFAVTLQNGMWKPHSRTATLLV